MPETDGSVAATRGKRNVQRKLYTEEEDPEDDEIERGKNIQAGSFVYIFVMCSLCVPSG